jgi:RIO-like serine/threonine protein kinase
MKKSIREMITGKPVVGEGASRIVYDLGNGYVLKVVKSERSLIYNTREVSMYKACPSPIRKHLANIIDHGTNWVIMKKYDREFTETEEYLTKLQEMLSTFKKSGIIPSDIKRQNLRLAHSGRIMVIDYGNFKFHNK